MLIDVTGISQAAVTKSLDTLVSSLAEIGGTIETVSIVDADGKQRVTPDLTPRTTEIDLAEAKRGSGLPLGEQSLAESLRKMRFDVGGARGQGARGKASPGDSGRFSFVSRLSHRHPAHGRSVRRRGDRLRVRQY